MHPYPIVCETWEVDVYVGDVRKANLMTTGLTHHGDGRLRVYHRALSRKHSRVEDECANDMLVHYITVVTCRICTAEEYVKLAWRADACGRVAQVENWKRDHCEWSLDDPDFAPAKREL